MINSFIRCKANLNKLETNQQLHYSYKAVPVQTVAVYVPLQVYSTTGWSSS